MAANPHREQFLEASSLRVSLLSALVSFCLAAIPSASLAQDGEETPPETDGETDTEGEGDGSVEAAGTTAKDLLVDYSSSYTWVDWTAGISQRETTAIALHPTNPDIGWIGGAGLVFGTTDGGKTWRQLLSVQGTGDVRRGRGGAGDEGAGVIEIDSRRDELIEVAVQERFEELREEALAEFAADVGDGDFAEELVEGIEEDLRETARNEVLTEGLDDIEAELRNELDIDEDEVEQQRVGNDDTEVLTEGNAVLEIVVHPTRPSEVYVATGTGVFRSFNGGRDWTNILTSIGGESGATTTVTVTENNVIVGTTSGLLVSTKVGGFEGYTGDLGELSIRHLAALGNRVYAVTDRVLFRSDDAGRNWERVVFGGGLADAEVSSVAIAPDNPDRIAIGSDQGVFVSDDGGRTIDQTSTVGLANLEIQHVIFHRAAPDMIVASTGRGVYASDRGTVWTALHEGLTAIVSRRLASSAVAPFALALATPFGGFRYLPREELEAQLAKIEAVRKQWRKEPKVTELLMETARYNGYIQSREDNWMWRQRLAFLLPDVRFGLSYDRYRLEDDQLRAVLPTAELQRDRALRTRPSAVEWEVFAVWNIGDILWEGRELRVARVARRLERDRRKLLSRVLKLYNKRRQLQFKRAVRKKPLSLEQDIVEEMKLNEMTARIDALTGSWFSDQIAGGEK